MFQILRVLTKDAAKGFGAIVLIYSDDDNNKSKFMKAVTCPQCGSLISKISAYQAIVECDYCGAKVLLGNESAPPRTDEFPIPQYTPFDNQSSNNPLPLIVIALLVTLGIGFVVFLLLIPKPKPRLGLNPPYPTPYSTPTAAPTPKKDDNILLEFGGKGTSAGLFDSPSEIVVGSDGSIYVADETLRVQRFDANGKFLNLWNVKGDGKKEAIEKLAVADDGTVYVLIGGEIVLFNGQTGEQKHVLTDSRRHYIDDFVLRDDGGMMYVAENEKNEEFVQTKGRAIVNRFVGIHTKAADADIPPEAIKITVDGKGDLYAVYALGGLNGEHSYDEEDLMTFHFSPQGKFINKFAAGLMPLEISVDNQSRVYILNQYGNDTGDIVVFSGAGIELKRINGGSAYVNAMAVDNQNYIYVIAGEKIRKLKAVNFLN